MRGEQHTVRQDRVTLKIKNMKSEIQPPLRSSAQTSASSALKSVSGRGEESLAANRKSQIQNRKLKVTWHRSRLSRWWLSQGQKSEIKPSLRSSAQTSAPSALKSVRGRGEESLAANRKSQIQNRKSKVTWHRSRLSRWWLAARLLSVLCRLSSVVHSLPSALILSSVLCPLPSLFSATITGNIQNTSG